MSDIAAPWIISEGLAGLQAQAIGLAEAAGLPHELRDSEAGRALEMDCREAVAEPAGRGGRGADGAAAPLVIGCGGMAGAVLAALRRQSMRVVQVQNPRMDIGRFDLIIANHHDELTGPNVFVTRTALHRVTPGAPGRGGDSLARPVRALPRPLVAVLLGGSNGRYPPRSGGRREAGRPTWRRWCSATRWAWS